MWYRIRRDFFAWDWRSLVGGIIEFAVWWLKESGEINRFLRGNLTGFSGERFRQSMRFLSLGGGNRRKNGKVRGWEADIYILK